MIRTRRQFLGPDALAAGALVASGPAGIAPALDRWSAAAPGRWPATVLSRRPAAVPARFLGPTFTVIGDDNSEPWDSWPWQAMVNSGGRLVLVQQLCGDWDSPRTTSTFARANLASRLTPITPAFAVVHLGMNDPRPANGPIPFTTFQANYTAICARLAAAGVVPVCATPVPVSGHYSSAPRVNQFLAQVARWVTVFAAAHDHVLVDFYGATADPSTGALKPGYFSPTGHPLARAGHTACARAFLTAVSPRLRGFRIPLATYEGDPNSLVSNGMALLDSDRDGVPDNWLRYPARRPAGVTTAIRTDPRFRAGKAIEVTVTAGQGPFELYLPVSAPTAKVAPRDWLLLLARFTIESSTGYPVGTENPGFGIGIQLPGQFPWINHYVTPPIVAGDSHPFAGAAHVPGPAATPTTNYDRAGVRPLFVFDSLPAGQRLRVRIGDVQLFNATRQGRLDAHGQPTGTPLWVNVNPGPAAVARGVHYYP